MNPARDLGPRILTAMVGYGKQVFTFRKWVAIYDCYVMTLTLVYSQYWLWCPVIAPIMGAQFGSLVYDVLLYTGEDSPVNRPYVFMLRVPHFIY